MCCLNKIHSRGKRLSHRVSFATNLFTPTFWAEVRDEEKEGVLKESDRLTYFSAALSIDDVATCTLCGFNLQHQKWSNCLSTAHKFISTCRSLHNMLWTWDQKSEKRLGTVVRGGKPGKGGIKQGQKTVQGWWRRGWGGGPQKSKSSKGVFEN